MKIGVFDSGYGGLTILSAIRHLLPTYDYIYLGDNARAPYGTRSFDVIYEYTRQAVKFLQQEECRLIIIACNTASAKALRTIQQHDIDPKQVRVLGVIRPTAEAVPHITRNGHIGIIATPGTIHSNSYILELEKMGIPLTISQQSCPLLVPLIETGELNNAGTDYFVHFYLQRLLAQDLHIDTLLLGCTHYPLLLTTIERQLQLLQHEMGLQIPPKIITQGDIIAKSLKTYLERHPEIDSLLSKHGLVRYCTTESAGKFADSATLFLSKPIQAQHVEY